MNQTKEFQSQNSEELQQLKNLGIQQSQLLISITETLESSQLFSILQNQILYRYRMATIAPFVLIPFINNKLSESEKKTLFLNMLNQWQDEQFIKFTHKEMQYYLTNMLKYMMLESFTKKDIEDPLIFQNIQNGISYRFEMFKQFSYVRQCAMVIWKAIIQKLEMKLPEQMEENKDDFLNFNDYPEYIFTEEDTQCKDDSIQEEEKQENEQNNNNNNININDILKSQNQENENEENQYSEQDSEDSDTGYSEDSYAEINIEADTQKKLSAPKHLYDCFLGLKGEDKPRLELSLKHLNYLIRKDLDDLEIMWEELAKILLCLHTSDVWMYNFDQYRTRALVSLSILKPEEMSRVLMQQLFTSDVSLGDRHFIVGILKDAALELSDNPKKYATENFNEYQSSENKTFYFKKLETKYLNKDQEMKIQKENQNKIERQEVINKKSKRWGHTRLNFEQQVGEDLRKIQKSDLSIIKPKKEEIFINKFNNLVNSFFFPLLIPIRTKHFQKFSQYKLLMTQIVQLVTVFLENGQNSHLFYKLVEETLEFLLKFSKETDVNFTRAKLQCLMKVTVLCKKEILLQYPLVIKKLVEMCKDLASQKITQSEDQNNKILMTMIINNIQELFSFTSMIPNMII